MSGVRTFERPRSTIAAPSRAKAGRTVSFCIPCRNEAATVGRISCAGARRADRRAPGSSTSSSSRRRLHRRHRPRRRRRRRARRADRRGAPSARLGDGKGNALWATLAVTHRRHRRVVRRRRRQRSSPSWVVAPPDAAARADDDLALVKASYHRPTSRRRRAHDRAGRPSAAVDVPPRARRAAPAADRRVRRPAHRCEQIPFACRLGGRDRDAADVAARFGAAAIGQVDLGERHHRHQPLHDLSVQAAEVLATLLARTGRGPFAEELRLASGEVVPLNLAERPPIARLSPLAGR